MVLERQRQGDERGEVAGGLGVAERRGERRLLGLDADLHGRCRLSGWASHGRLRAGVGRAAARERQGAEDGGHEPPCRPHHGWLAGPTVNSFTVVSSGRSMANATTRAIRSGEIPNRSYSCVMPSADASWVMVPSSSVLIAAG